MILSEYLEKAPSEYSVSCACPVGALHRTGVRDKKSVLLKYPEEMISFFQSISLIGENSKKNPCLPREIRIAKGEAHFTWGNPENPCPTNRL